MHAHPHIRTNSQAKAAEKAAKKAAKEEAKRRKKTKGKGEVREMEIGLPTNFKHVTHVGWDEAAGFQVQNLPPEWKQLFKERRPSPSPSPSPSP